MSDAISATTASSSKTQHVDVAVVGAGFSGLYVDHFGYAQFFVSTALLGVPVLVLVWLASRVHAVHSTPPSNN